MKMDWELACYELLIYQHQWFDLFEFWIYWKTILSTAEEISMSKSCQQSTY